RCGSPVARVPPRIVGRRWRVLPLAVTHPGVRVNRRFSQGCKRGPDPWFRSVEDAARALQRFSQRAHTRLLGALSLTTGTPTQSLLEEKPVVVHVGEIVVRRERRSEASSPTVSPPGPL